MKVFFLIISMSIISWSSYAHAPNEAFFEFFESDKQLLIKVEFPWTIREALLTAKPELRKAQTNEEMTAGLLAYLQEHIEVRNEQNQLIRIQSIKEAPNTNGHGHGSVYMLLLGENQWISSIKNTCMFDAYSDQTNFHSIEADGASLKFVTNKEKAKYTIQTNVPISEHQGFPIAYVLVGIASVLCLLIIGFLRKRSA